MRKFCLICCMLAWLGLPIAAQEPLATPPTAQDESADNSRNKLLKGLLKAGGRAAVNYLDKKLGENDAPTAAPVESVPPAAAAAPAEASGEPKRTWRERGGDMVKSFLARSAEEMGDEPLSRWLAHALKQALDVLLEEYKDQYKDEGRAYAKELGDKMLERVREDPEISASITSLQVLCWCVIGYLSLVTLIMLACLLYLKRANGRLLAAINELRRERAAK